MFNSAHLADNNFTPGIRFYKIDVFVSVFFLFVFCLFFFATIIHEGGMLCQFVLSLCVCVFFFFLT